MRLFSTSENASDAAESRPDVKKIMVNDSGAGNDPPPIDTV